MVDRLINFLWQDSHNNNMESAANSIVASALYSGCSVGMVLVNKMLASRYVLYYVMVCSFVLYLAVAHTQYTPT